jgi:hypothetical protein
LSIDYSDICHSLKQNVRKETLLSLHLVSI